MCATVDCTDLRVYEPVHFSANWYSHKENAAAVRYKLAVSTEGKIVWLNGPFRAGEYSDLKIFRSRLRSELRHSELFIADGTYSDVKCIFNDGCDLEFIQRCRARQETVFKRLKILIYCLTFIVT